MPGSKCLPLLMLLLYSLPVAAQEFVDRRGTADPRHALERIEKSLRELDQMFVETTPEIREAIESLREASATLKTRLGLAEEADMLLIELKLVDLGAERAGAAWFEQMGLPPNAPMTMTAEKLAKVPSLPGLLSAPSILTLDGQEAQLKVEEAQELSYLQRQRDGSYLEKTIAVEDGLSITMTPKIEKEGTIHLDLLLDIKKMEGRTEYAPGAPTVGMPIISRRSCQSELRLAPDRAVAIMPMTDGTADIVVIVEVRRSPKVKSK